MDWAGVYPAIQNHDDFLQKLFGETPDWRHGQVFTACITSLRYSSLKPCKTWAEKEARRYVFCGPRGVGDFPYIACIEREPLDDLYARSKLKPEHRDNFIRLHYAHIAPDDLSAIILWINDTRREYRSNRVPLFPMREYERLTDADAHCVLVAMGGFRPYIPPPT